MRGCGLNGGSVLLAAVLVAWAAGARPSQAATLTCDAFKIRLNGALLAIAGSEAAAVAFTPGFTDPARGTRYDWAASDLDGTMSCGPADQFQEFGVAVRFRSKDTFADTLKRFVAVQGASVCALASDSPPECENTGRAMLQEALSMMGRAYNRGARSPSGLADRTLLPGVQAELTAAATLVTFLIGPGRGNSMEDSREPLLKSFRPPTP